MFQLTQEEMDNWKSQIVISNKEKRGLRKRPYAFTQEACSYAFQCFKQQKSDSRSQYTDHEGIYSAKGVDSHPWRSEKEA